MEVKTTSKKIAGYMETSLYIVQKFALSFSINSDAKVAMSSADDTSLYHGRFFRSGPGSHAAERVPSKRKRALYLQTPNKVSDR